MEKFQKGGVNAWLITIIFILLLVFVYFALVNKPVTEVQQVNSTPEKETNSISNNNQTPVQTVSQAPTESEIIQKLLSSWKMTQSKFAAKAGESGTFNPPSKIQFISADTILVYFDDGLVDHISVVQFKNNSFVELKNVGVMSTMSQAQWQTFVNTYGNANYQVSNYQSYDYKTFAKVYNNIFVR